jgi:hypothetical protein
MYTRKEEGLGSAGAYLHIVVHLQWGKLKQTRLFDLGTSRATLLMNTFFLWSLVNTEYSGLPRKNTAHNEGRKDGRKAQ